MLCVPFGTTRDAERRHLRSHAESGNELGNRLALEWVIDQYRVSEDARAGIRSDPNRLDDPEYIVRLVGQVVLVSVETVKVVVGLPEAFT